MCRRLVDCKKNEGGVFHLFSISIRLIVDVLHVSEAACNIRSVFSEDITVLVLI